MSVLGLDIGCGEKKRPDMIGLDFRRTASVDIVADARNLPFRSESFDHVFSNHLIEHFSHGVLHRLMVEWVRVLRKGGRIEIRCPDLRARALMFFLSPTLKNIKKIYGEQDYEGNYHKSGFSYGLLKHLLESCGITSLRRIIKGYKGVPFIPDCLHISGTKS